MSERQATLDIIKAALDAFAAGKIGERELIAINLACNAELKRLLPVEKYGDFADGADKALMERIAELDAEAS